MNNALNMGHPAPTTTECPVKRAIPRYVSGTRPNPKMRDCVNCKLPFFSKSTANVVCVVCKSESTAEFDGGL